MFDRRSFVTTGLALLAASPLVAPLATAREAWGLPGDPMSGMAGDHAQLDALALAQPVAIDPLYERQLVDFAEPGHAGSVVIDTQTRFLYLVRGDGTAIRYGVGVGRDGFNWHGTAFIGAKRPWPAWHPPAAMRQRQPYLPESMAGGLDNPLGARALYLHEQDGRDTLYRVHGTNEPHTIGHAVSSGCIRMLNADVMDLYRRVPIGTRVTVLPNMATS